MPIDVTEGFKRDVLGAAEAPGSAGAEPKGSAVAEEFRRETLGVVHPGHLATMGARPRIFSRAEELLFDLDDLPQGRGDLAGGQGVRHQRHPTHPGQPAWRACAHPAGAAGRRDAARGVPGHHGRGDPGRRAGGLAGHPDPQVRNGGSGARDGRPLPGRRARVTVGDALR
jgi:hypothetical protein